MSSVESTHVPDEVVKFSLSSESELKSEFLNIHNEQEGKNNDALLLGHDSKVLHPLNWSTSSSPLSHTYIAELFRSGWKQVLHLKYPSKNAYLQEIPLELLLLIVEFCDARTMAIMSCVCKAFHKLCSGESLWRTLYLRKWTLSHAEVKQLSFSALSWKAIVSRREVLETNWRTGNAVWHTNARAHHRRIECINLNSHSIMSGSHDRSIKIWDLNSGQQRGELKGHTKAIRCMQSDEYKVISGSSDREMRVWNLRTGECMQTLTNPHTPVTCLSFDPSDVLASGGMDSLVRVWDLRRAEQVALLPGHNGPVKQVRLVGDHMIVSTSTDRTVRVWDTRLPVLEANVTTLNGHSTHVDHLMLNTSTTLDGATASILTASTRACEIRGWDLRIGGLSDGKNLEGEHAVPFMAVDCKTKFNCISLSQQHRLSTSPGFVATGHDDNIVRLWDMDGSLRAELEGHSGPVECLQVDHAKIVSGGRDSTVRTWDSNSFVELNRFELDVFLEDGKARAYPSRLAYKNSKLVVGTSTNTLLVYDFERYNTRCTTDYSCLPFGPCCAPRSSPILAHQPLLAV